MGIVIKRGDALEGMRRAGRVAARVLHEVCQAVRVGINTYDLDQLAKKVIAAHGAQSACYLYRVGDKVYPNHICLSINEEIVHGIGVLERVIEAGDVVSVDVVTRFEGYIGDNARTVIVGEVAAEVAALVEDTEKALYLGIEQARVGKRVGDISFAIQQFLRKKNYGIVREFVGHGLGVEMHEDPQIPNYGKKKTGEKLKEGMVIAIEPMVNLGSHDVLFLEDGWTAVAADGLPAAHFEHTVLITKGDPEILTRP